MLASLSSDRRLNEGDNVAANRLLEAHLLPERVPLSGIAAACWLRQRLLCPACRRSDLLSAGCSA